MNDDDLRKLFERSKAEPSAFELTRMSARARELPSRLERVPRGLPRWSWAPAFAALAAAGALGLTLTEVLSSEGPSAPPSAAPRVPRHSPAAKDAVAPSALLTSSAPPERTVPLVDDADFDALSLTPATDDDPFDLSAEEEKELSK